MSQATTGVPAQQYDQQADNPPRPPRQPPFEIDMRISLRMDHDTAELLLETIKRGLDPQDKRMFALTKGLEYQLQRFYGDNDEPA